MELIVQRCVGIDIGKITLRATRLIRNNYTVLATSEPKARPTT